MNSLKINVGTDIVEVKRLRLKPIKDHTTFYKNIFTESELMHCLKFSDPYPHLAGIFAAKEAIIKCYDKPLRMVDIKITWDTNGKPIAIVHYEKKTNNVNISISHTQMLAIAVAINTT